MEPEQKPALGRGKRFALAVAMPLVLLAVFLLVAPLLLAGPAARAVEDAFAEQHLGRLELGVVDLAWTQPQTLRGGRLLDPQGQTVASFSAQLPTLFELATGRGQRLGRVRVELTADLVADDAGTINLQRALASRGSPGTAESETGEGPGGAPEPEGSPIAFLADLELDLELSIPRFSWSDLTTRTLGAPVALEDVLLTISLAPGEPLELDLTGRVRSQTGGELILHSTLAELGSPARALTLECAVTSLPTGLVDGLAGLGGELSDLLGPALDLRVAGQGSVAGGELELHFESAAARVDLAAGLDDGGLGLTSELSLELAPERLEGWIDPSLPAGLLVEHVSSGAFTAAIELSTAEFGAWLEHPTDAFPATVVAVRELLLGDWRVASAAPEVPGAARTWTGLQASAQLDAQRGGTITLTSEGPDPLEVTLALGADLLPGGVEASAPGLPTELLDQLTGLDGQLTRLVGTRLDLRAALPGTATGFSGGTLVLNSPQLEVLVHASYEQGLLSLEPAAESDPGVPVLLYRAPERLLREFAPELDTLHLLGDLQLVASPFELPLGAWLAGDLAPEDLVNEGRANLTLRLGALEYTHELGDGSTAPITLEAVELDVQVAAGAAHAELSAAVRDSEGVLSVQLEAADLVALAADPEASPGVLVSARASNLSTLTVDLLAEQSGLLVEMLGRQLSLRAEGQWPARGQPFEIELESPEASLEFEGTLQDGVIVAGEEQHLTATAPLGPLFSSRVVGRLVPLLVGVTKAPDAAPVLMRVESFRFPLDGDLSRLDCDVYLELGDVSYQLLPGFQGALENRTGGDARARTSHIDPLEIKVRGGVVTYEKTPLKIDGVEVLVGGTFDLLTGTVKMTTLVPLKNLGKGVGRELERARDFLDPALAVPIEIGGHITRPTIGLGKSFLETVLPGTVRGAIRGGLQDLFGRNKEKEAEEQRRSAEKKARKKARREAEEAARKEAEEPGL